MKKYFTLFLSPLLSVMCTASFLWVNNGAFVLLIMLFRDLCVPLIHFGIIGSFIKRSDVKKSVSALAALSLLPIVIFNGLMFEALFDAGVNISMISTSEIKISVLIDEKDVERGMIAVHDKFNLAESNFRRD